MAQLWSVSEGILVLFFGSKFSIWKSVALREEVRRNLLSGCFRLISVRFHSFSFLQNKKKGKYLQTKFPQQQQRQQACSEARKCRW